MLKIVISAGLLIAAAVLSLQMILQARQNQVMKTDLAEINHIRHGLLDADEWAERVTLIISRRIVEFDLTPENREELQASLETILYKLIDDLEVLLEERTSGQLAGMKKFLLAMVLDVNQLRDSVPAFAGTILDEINEPRTKLAIQAYLSDKLDDLSEATYALDSTEVLTELLEKYDCPDPAACRELLSAATVVKAGAVNTRVMLILVLVTGIFLLNSLVKSPPGRYPALLLILSSFCLLAGGITTPMIDLEAKIDRLSFLLTGEEVVFTDNIIFFQSKSITDIVEILVTEGSFDMIFAGILVFTFSIVFPLSKLISSFLYSLRLDNLNRNRLIRFFVFKSGKWSMADVLVLAIFMAYIGFNGIIGSQLESLRESSGPVEIFTTNGTRLLGGFYLFLAFCISSLVLSGILTRKTEK